MSNFKCLDSKSTFVKSNIDPSKWDKNKCYWEQKQYKDVYPEYTLHFDGDAGKINNWSF